MNFVTYAETAIRLQDAADSQEQEEILVELFNNSLDNSGSTSESTRTLATIARFLEGRTTAGWGESSLDISPKRLYHVVSRAADGNPTVSDIEEQVSFVGDIPTALSTYELSQQQNLLAYNTGKNSAGDNRVSVLDVNEAIEDIRSLPNDDTTQREDALFGLLIQLDDVELPALVRVLLGEPVVEDTLFSTTLQNALAESLSVPSNSFQDAVDISKDYEQACRVALTEGQQGLISISVEVGKPIDPMRAEIGTIKQATKDWDQVAVEPKYNGARAQVHYDGEDQVYVFSQNGEDISSRTPEVVRFVKQTVDDPVIMDGELVVFTEDKTPLGLQAVLNRLRAEKPQQALENQSPLTFVAFDCLYKNSRSKMDETLRVRYQTLWKTYPQQFVAPQRLFSSMDGIANFETNMLDDGHEGIMLKHPQSVYDASERNENWRKVKPSTQTLDLAVTGGEFADKDNAEIMSAFLLSAKTNHGFKPVGKLDKGISTEQRKRLTEAVQPYITARAGTTVAIQPSVVVQIGYEDVVSSRAFTSGVSLGMPRFIGLREDMSVEQADSTSFVASLIDPDNPEPQTEDTSSQVRVALDNDSSDVFDMGEGVNITEKGADKDDDDASAGADEGTRGDSDDDDDDDDDGSKERIYTG